MKFEAKASVKFESDWTAEAHFGGNVETHPAIEAESPIVASAFAARVAVGEALARRAPVDMIPGYYNVRVCLDCEDFAVPRVYCVEVQLRAVDTCELDSWTSQEHLGYWHGSHRSKPEAAE